MTNSAFLDIHSLAFSLHFSATRSNIRKARFRAPRSFFADPKGLQGRAAWRNDLGRSSDTCRRTRAGIRACTHRSGYARTRARARRRRGTCQRPARRRGAMGRTRARSARRRPSVGDADGPTPTERAATPGGVVACRRRAPPAPRHSARHRRRTGAHLVKTHHELTVRVVVGFEPAPPPKLTERAPPWAAPAWGSSRTCPSTPPNAPIGRGRWRTWPRCDLRTDTCTTPPACRVLAAPGTCDAS